MEMGCARIRLCEEEEYTVKDLGALDALLVGQFTGDALVFVYRGDRENIGVGTFVGTHWSVGTLFVTRLSIIATMNIVNSEQLVGVCSYFSHVTRTTLYSLCHTFEFASLHLLNPYSFFENVGFQLAGTR